MIPLTQRTRLLLAAAAVLLLVNVALLVVRPGNLEDEGDARAIGAPGATTTSTTSEDDEPAGTSSTSSPTSTTEDVGTDTSDPGVEASGGQEGEAPASTTSTTAPAGSSGLGTEGAGSAQERDLADTGGLPLAAPGAALLGAAALARRLARQPR